AGDAATAARARRCRDNDTVPSTMDQTPPLPGKTQAKRPQIDFNDIHYATIRSHAGHADRAAEAHSRTQLSHVRCMVTRHPLHWEPSSTHNGRRTVDADHHIGHRGERR